MHTKPISFLFNEPPIQWGLRGDPGLWDEFKIKSGDLYLPESAEELENKLHILFLEIIGFKPVPDKNYYVACFDIGGMSRGMVSSDFWLGKGFAVIIKRYFDYKFPVTKMFYIKYREVTELLDNKII